MAARGRRNGSQPYHRRFDGVYRTSPGPDHPFDDNLDHNADPAQSVAAMLRMGEADLRTAQPGTSRLAEQGAIANGRAIASPINCPTSSTSSSQTGPAGDSTTQPGQPAPTPAASGPKVLHLPVRRVTKRKARGPEVVHNGVSAFRLLKEAQTFSAPQGCHAAPKNDDLYEWAAVIEGPPDTVYAGGTFFCTINLPPNYPFAPPKLVFLTRIYHCNINTKGEVCVDILRHNWRSTMTVSTVLESILSLMYQCNPDDALVTSIGTQYKENRELFEKTARIWTTRYAT